MTTTKDHEKDYGADEIDIQAAKVRHVKGNPDRATRTKHILWNGEPVWTTFDIAVPEDGRFRIEFLSEAPIPLQGVDVQVEGGAITLSEGESLQTLRTWHDERYEPVVEYPFKSKSRLIRVWNVYERTWPDGRTTEKM